MPVSGLVLTLQEDSSLQEDVMGILSNHQSICLGQQQKQKLPLVLDTVNKEENKRMLNWMQSIPGVIHIDVVYVSLEEDTEEISNSQINRETLKA